MQLHDPAKTWLMSMHFAWQHLTPCAYEPHFGESFAFWRSSSTFLIDWSVAFSSGITPLANVLPVTLKENLESAGKSVYLALPKVCWVIALLRT